jgi:hypothetical protein
LAGPSASPFEPGRHLRISSPTSETVDPSASTTAFPACFSVSFASGSRIVSPTELNAWSSWRVTVEGLLQLAPGLLGLGRPSLLADLPVALGDDASELGELAVDLAPRILRTRHRGLTSSGTGIGPTKSIIPPGS